MPGMQPQAQPLPQQEIPGVQSQPQQGMPGMQPQAQPLPQQEIPGMQPQPPQGMPGSADLAATENQG